MQPETSLCYYKISNTNILFTICNHYRIMKCCLCWPNIILIQFNFPESCRFIRCISFQVKVLLYILSLHIMVCHFPKLISVSSQSTPHKTNISILELHMYTYTHVCVHIKSPAGPGDPPGKLSVRSLLSCPGCFPPMVLPC